MEKYDREPSKSTSPELPARGTLRPPAVGVYCLADPEDIAAARAMRDPNDAAELFALLAHARWRKQEARTVLLKAAAHWRAHRGGAGVLLAEMRTRALAPLANQLASLPRALLQAAGSPAEIAAAVIYRADAFAPPHAPRPHRRAA